MQSKFKSGIYKSRAEATTPGRHMEKKQELSSHLRPDPDMPVASKKMAGNISKAESQSRRFDDKENFASTQSKTPQREKSLGKHSGVASIQNSPSRAAKQLASNIKSRTPDFKQSPKPTQYNQKKELLKLEEDEEPHKQNKPAKPQADSGSKNCAPKLTREKKGSTQTPTSSRYSSRVEERVTKSPIRADPSPTFSKLKRSVIDSKSHVASLEDEDETDEIDIDGDSLLDSLRAKCQTQYNPEKLTTQFLNIINNPTRRSLMELMPQSKCHTMKDGRNFMKIGEVDIFYDKVDIEEILNLGMRTKMGTLQN